MKSWNSLFAKTDIRTYTIDIFKKIDKDWFLITAGDEKLFNTMTASWGTMGTLWNKSVVICFVRPVRYTFDFIDNVDIFTCSFLGKEHKKILSYCGAHSGRDADKIKITGLAPLQLENGGISFEQSETVIECKKIYFDDIKPVFILPEEIDDEFYPNKDYHRMFIGEVQTIYKKTR